jgi:hypothetical protein
LPEGAFNIIELARRLGLKNVQSMPVTETVTPVAVVGDLAGLTPQLVPPAGIFADTAGAVVAEFGTFYIQSLAPGGTRVKAIQGNGAAFGFVLLTGAPPALTGEADMTVFVTSNQAPISRARFGTAAAIATQVFAVIANVQFLEIPFFLPRGAFAILQSQSVNVAVTGMFHIEDVPASEHGPS